MKIEKPEFKTYYAKYYTMGRGNVAVGDFQASIYTNESLDKLGIKYFVLQKTPRDMDRTGYDPKNFLFFTDLNNNRYRVIDYLKAPGCNGTTFIVTRTTDEDYESIKNPEL